MDGKNTYKFKKYGKSSKSNVRWTYNFDPLGKIITVMAAMVLVATSFLLYQDKKEKSEKLNRGIEESKERGSKSSGSEAENEIKALQGILRSIQESQSGKAQNAYVWNENGKTVASNTRYPPESSNVRVIEGIKNDSRETKYIKEGNSILLPVIIGNQGRAIQVKMMLDTGCSITMLDEEVSFQLGFQPKATSESIVADGRKIQGTIGNIDFFQVGPFKEMGMQIKTNQVMGNQKTHHGLIGMNFLEKHPFTIDHRKQVIRWQ